MNALSLLCQTGLRLNLQYSFSHILCPVISDGALNSMAPPMKNILSVHSRILGGVGHITVNLQALPVSLAASIKVTLVSSYSIIGSWDSFLLRCSFGTIGGAV